MRRKLLAGALALGLLGVVPPVAAADSVGEAPVPEVLRSRTVGIDEGLRRALCASPSPSGAPGEVTLDLFEDVRVRARARLVERPAEGSVSWRGEVDGSPDSSVVLSAAGACGEGDEVFLDGAVFLNGQLFGVRSAGAGSVEIREQTPSPLVDDNDDAVAAPEQVKAARRLRDSGGSPVLDVLALYTTGFKEGSGGDAGAGNRIRAAVAVADLAYANSKAKPRLRVVHVAEAPGRSDSADRASLDALAKADDVRGMRDRYGADLVSLFVSEGANPGVGYLSKGPAPDRAFSVQDAFRLTTFAHETGHNLGLDHERTATPRATRASYDHGFVAPSGKWHTIMAGAGPCKGCATVPYFSNPDLTYQGEQMGVRVREAQSADNRRVLDAIGPIAAAYRPSRADDKAYALTVADPGAGGTAEAEEAGPFPPGTIVTAEAKPDPGHVFAGWSLDGRPLERAEPSLAVTMDQEHTVTARFEKDAEPYRLITTAVAPEGGGTVRRAAAGPEYPVGGQVLITAKPADGYGFTGWKIDGFDTGGSPALTVTADRDRTVAATFARRRFTLATEWMAGGGSVQVSKLGPYAPGETVVAEALPAPGHGFDGWMIGDQRVGVRPRIAVRVTADQRLRAVFVAQPYKLTTSVSPSGGGTVSATKSGQFAYGQETTLTANPAAGYVFSRWVLDGEPAGSTPRLDLRMEKSRVLKAEFVKARADLTVSGKAPKLVKGKRATYVWTVTNRGPHPAAKAALTAPLPRGLKQGRVTGAGCRASGNGIRCQWSALKPGQKVVVRQDVTVAKNAGKTLTVAATVSGGTPDPNKKNNKANTKAAVKKK